MNELLRADQRKWTDQVGALERQLDHIKKEKEDVSQRHFCIFFIDSLTVSSLN